MDKKYYVKSGEFEKIIMAPDGSTAVTKVLDQLLRSAFEALMSNSSPPSDPENPGQPNPQFLKEIEATLLGFMTRCGTYSMASQKGFDPAGAEGLIKTADAVNLLASQKLMSLAFREMDNDAN